MSALARTRRQVWRALVAVAFVGAGVWVGAHGVAGVHWGDVLGVLAGLSGRQVAALAAVWLGGLGIYATVLAAALPGLGLRRGLLLNLSGSAVANTVPLGGGLATALNWRMVRRWGHSDRAFATFAVLTNVLDVAAKLVLPVVAVATLLVLSSHVPRSLWAITGGCLAALVVLAAALAVPRPPGLATGGRGARLLARLREHVGRVRGLFLSRWARLVPGSVGYVATQVLLLWLALRSAGLDVPLTVVLTAAAIERLATLVPITPGGAGVAEMGTIAWLVAAGLPAAQVVAGVLVYRIFLFAMEIPVGGLLLAGWAWLHRSTWSPWRGSAAT